MEPTSKPRGMYRKDGKVHFFDPEAAVTMIMSESDFALLCAVFDLDPNDEFIEVDLSTFRKAGYHLKVTL